MSSLDANLFSTISPVSYKDWARYTNNTSNNKQTYNAYTSYVKKWYSTNYNSTDSTKINKIKEDYILLLKSLSQFFKDQDKDLFIKDIDFSKTEEIIYSIPLFVRKLKEIAISYTQKRETIKRTKKKYDSIGTTQNLTSVIRDNLLRSQTRNSLSIEAATLSSVFPELAEVKKSLYLEFEELHDDSTYSDNSINTVLFDRLSNNALFPLFNDYLTRASAGTLSAIEFDDYTLNSTPNTINLTQLNANQIGTNLLYLTAIEYAPEDTQDSSATFTFSPGNNWFYWPTGEVYTDLSTTQNIYAPVSVNNSVLASSAVDTIGGNTYESSDLLFVEHNGTIQGAWLKGNSYSQYARELVMTAIPNTIRSFIFPTPGYDITDKLKYRGRSFDDKGLSLFNSLDPRIRETFYNNYITDTSISGRLINSLYINQTNLVYSGAEAGYTILDSDSITVRPGGAYNDTLTNIPAGSYTDTSLTQSALLYRLSSTELIADNSNTYVLWPYAAYDPDLPIYTVPTEDTCNSINIQNINTNTEMLGIIANTDPALSDTILKLSSKNGQATDAAWLKTGSIKDLATTNSYSIPVYSISAINCTDILDGPVQSNLHLNAPAGSRTSFVWCDIDTPADEVFNYKEHSLDCPYNNTNKNYATASSTEEAEWSKCACKSVYYSPIGHNGLYYTDNNANADVLFADPQNLGDTFNIAIWRDTRGFNYKTSPQFSYFNVNSQEKRYIGWGEGSWKTGNSSKMILKTGRRYTYMRAGIRSYSGDTAVPPMISYYPYKRIIGSFANQVNSDIIFAIDVSGSQYFSYKKNIQLVSECVDSINVSTDTQIGLLVFSNTAVVLSYLTQDKLAFKRILNTIELSDTTAPTNIVNAINAANDTFTKYRGGTEKSLAGLSSNIDIITSIGADTIQSINIPRASNKKVLVLVSDGDFKEQTDKALDLFKTYNYIKPICVDVGPNSPSNSNMERVANASNGEYINYESILLNADTNSYNTKVSSTIVSAIFGNVSLQPTWYKGAYNPTTDTLTDTGELSNMVIHPGDFLRINRVTQYSYTADTGNSFSVKKLPAVIKIKLYGWNYESKQPDSLAVGAKPYWGKVYNSPDLDNNFNKGSREFAGHVRYYNDYLPLSHPELSEILLSYGDYIEYRNKGCRPLRWVESIKYETLVNQKKWCKLKICTQPYNLKSLFDNINIDKYFEQTEEESDIALATYLSSPPAYYNYFRRGESDLSFSQPLNELKNLQGDIFREVLSGTAIQPVYAHRNLDNLYYASIPLKPSEDMLISVRDVGRYLLPSLRGVPYIVGKGYTNIIDLDRVRTLQSNTDKPLVFAHPNLYTSNRGLTRQDQYSPYIPYTIDNTWVKDSMYSKGSAGVIINSIDYQKFVPYQSDYETYKESHFGISRQQDNFEFWSKNTREWNEKEKYPLNFKKEVSPAEFQKRIEHLLIGNKIQAVWKTDVYGNNFSILKEDTLTGSINERRNISGELWIRTTNDRIHKATNALSSIYNKYKDKYSTLFNDLTASFIQNIELYNNAFLIKTPSGVFVERYAYDIELDTFATNTYSEPVITLPNNVQYAGEWYFEEENKVQMFTLEWISATPSYLSVFGYEYDIDNDTFTRNYKGAISTSSVV